MKLSVYQYKNLGLLHANPCVEMNYSRRQLCWTLDFGEEDFWKSLPRNKFLVGTSFIGLERSMMDFFGKKISP